MKEVNYDEILALLEAYCNSCKKTIRCLVQNDGSLKFIFVDRNQSEIPLKTKIIYGDRRSGKTTELIKICSKDRYSLIVCPNRGMCESTFITARKLGYYIPVPLTIGEFVNRKYEGRNIDCIYFDDMETCLTVLSGYELPVKGIVFGSHKTEIINR